MFDIIKKGRVTIGSLLHISGVNANRSALSLNYSLFYIVLVEIDKTRE